MDEVEVEGGDDDDTEEIEADLEEDDGEDDEEGEEEENEEDEDEEDDDEEENEEEEQCNEGDGQGKGDNDEEDEEDTEEEDDEEKKIEVETVHSSDGENGAMQSDGSEDGEENADRDRDEESIESCDNFQRDMMQLDEPAQPKKKKSGGSPSQRKTKKSSGTVPTMKKKQNNASKKKGKDAEILVDTDDSGDDFSFGGEDMMGQMAKAAKEANTGSVEIFLTPTVQDPHTGKSFKIVTFADKKGCFFNKAQVVQAAVRAAFKKKNALKPMPSWIDSIHDINIRAEPHGLDSKYKRSSNGKTTQVWTMIFETDTTKEAQLMSDLRHAIKMMFHVYQPRDKNPCGKICMTILRNTQKLEGVHKWAIREFKTDDEAEKVLGEMMEGYFKHGPSFVHDCHLDQFMVDSDIKEILENKLSATSWDDVSDEMKRICYKNYPNRTLPVWNDIRVERF